MVAGSAILGIPQIQPAQNNKYVTHNDAIDMVEAACGNGRLANSSLGAGNWTLTEAQFAHENFMFIASGQTSATRDLIFPSTVNSVNTKRFFVVQNADNDQALRVKASSGSGATVTIPFGYVAFLRADHEDVYLISAFQPGASFSQPYDIGIFVPSMPADAALICGHAVVRAATFAANFSGSKGNCQANPTSTAVFTINKNGSGIGTVSINTSGVFTFASSGGTAQTVAAGDVITVTAPSPDDATLSDISITLLGTIVL